MKADARAEAGRGADRAGSGRRGVLFVVSAPSGAGKTSLIAEVLRRMPEVSLSVSYATRRPRPHEKDGREYHFRAESEFQAMAERGEFVEYAKVHGNWYGTHAGTLEAMRAGGRDVVLEIDCQGARQVKNAFRHGVFIFILPPSMEELRRRLMTRDSETPEMMEQRIANARREFAEAPFYDYRVVNDRFEDAAADLQAIFRAEQIRAQDHKALLEQFMPQDTQVDG